MECGGNIWNWSPCFKGNQETPELVSYFLIWSVLGVCFAIPVLGSQGWVVPRARNLADEIRVESHNQKTRWEMPRSSMKDESCPSWIKRVKKRGACAQRTDVEADVETVWSRHSDLKKKMRHGVENSKWWNLPHILPSCSALQPEQAQALSLLS